MATATKTLQLGFGFGAAIELHLLLIGDKRWFSLDRSGQFRLPFRSLVAQVMFFDVDDYRFDRASMTLFDGRSVVTFASSALTTQVNQSIAMSGATKGSIIKIDLDAIGSSLVSLEA